MNYKVGRSTHTNIFDAIKEATSELKKPKLIIFFSEVEPFEAYSKAIKEHFPESLVIGSTTFACLCKDGAYKKTLMVLGIESGIECYGDILEEADQYPIKYVNRIETCVKALSNTANTVCFTFTTALISCEELVLSTLNSVLMKSNIPLFGGSAGDIGQAEQTMVSFNGKVYGKSSIFVLIKNLSGSIKLYQENIYKPTRHHFTATKVDVRNRIVYEYDGQPAAPTVAKALGTDLSHLPNFLDSCPMGRLIGSDMYITANKEVIAKGGMAYHARVYKNSQMVVLEIDDYKKVIQRTLEAIHKDIAQPKFTLMVHCLARSILFEKEGYLNHFAQEMGAALGDFVGFSGYGEQMNQQHFNQTMIVAVFE